jgi:hypothetical protein
MLTDMPMHYARSGFPWGLLIVAGIIYFLWSKGVFDGRGRWGSGGRWGGPGGPGGPGGFGPAPGGGYAPAPPVEQTGYGAGQGGYDAQRAMFEEWRRQAHAAGAEHGRHVTSPAPSAPAAESAPEGEQPQSGTAV